MNNKDKCFERFKLKKCLDATIDVLLAQELTSQELTCEVNKIVKSMLPKSNSYMLAVVINYAKQKSSLYCYEKVLDSLINDYKV